MPDDLWPDDIAKVTMIAPVTILKQQGVLLGKRTRNLVEGKVASISQEYWTYTDGFGYAFYIVAPALGYQYRLLAISHRIDPYPVRVQPNVEVWMGIPEDIRGKFTADSDLPGLGPEKVLLAKNQDEFERILKAAFESGKTKRVIESILAQSGLARTA